MTFEPAEPVVELLKEWRRESLDPTMHKIEANTLQCCASQLERVWHEYAHRHNYHAECPLCVAENPPDGRGRLYTPSPAERLEMLRRGVLSTRPIESLDDAL